MRVSTAVLGLVVAGAVASAQATSPGQRVRVLGDTMARQVVTRVNPVYPAAALEKGVAGEVTLYAAVGKDGSVEQVAVVDGPNALQNAAMDAVKQWKFRPWLVDGAPVEVDTTVVVDFKPGMESAAPAVAAVPAQRGAAMATMAPSGGLRASVKPPAVAGSGSRSVAASANVPAATRVASGGVSQPGTIDWEADRRAGAMPVGPGMGAGSAVSVPPMAAPAAAKPAVMSNVSVPSERVAAAGVLPAAPVITKPAMTAPAAAMSAPAAVMSAPAAVMSAPAAASVPLYTALPAPAGHAVLPGTTGMLAPGSAGEAVRLASRQGSAPLGSTIYAPSVPMGIVRGNDGRTEWQLVKKVAPEYPQDAVDAGIEGVVLVAGVVKTDGMLRDLHAVSGPKELYQAAVDAASQYVYEPVMHGDELGEARTQVPVVFTLSGPAKVPAEVMAGRIVDSFTPPYPPEAVKAGVSGAVILRVLIGRQGDVKDVKVVSGREMLRAAAIDAVKQWHYKPYKRNGVDVEVETDVEVQFTLLKE